MKKFDVNIVHGIPLSEELHGNLKQTYVYLINLTQSDTKSISNGVGYNRWLNLSPMVLAIIVG